MMILDLKYFNGILERNIAKVTNIRPRLDDLHHKSASTRQEAQANLIRYSRRTRRYSKDDLKRAGFFQRVKCFTLL